MIDEWYRPNLPLTIVIWWSHEKTEQEGNETEQEKENSNRRE